MGYSTTTTMSFNKFLEKVEGAPVDKISKIFGIQWNTETDQLILSMPKSPEINTTWTKRKVLKHVASIYDPLGWVSPSTLIAIAKAFVQKLWKIQFSWDTVLPPELSQEWTIQKIRFPRKIAHTSTYDTKYDLHISTDASKTAYCAVAYIVSHQNNHHPEIAFPMAKSHIIITISNNTNNITPRISLIIIRAKFAGFLLSQLHIINQQSYILSDRKVALMCAKCEKSLPVFIRNRVKSIKTNAPSATLHYIPGDQTRQVFAGPAFLRDSEEKWPEDTSHLTTTDDDEQEEVSSHQKLRLHTYYCFKKNDSTPGRDFSTL
ncbi:hypothetical protein RB195_010606 [Necator americanus]|uniref:Pao retrotransposon peptidase n=1 Tax=Necator americanus TaxID=51031 RepID=A0ABR1CYP6_NECAM